MYRITGYSILLTLFLVVYSFNSMSSASGDDDPYQEIVNKVQNTLLSNKEFMKTNFGRGMERRDDDFFYDVYIHKIGGPNHGEGMMVFSGSDVFGGSHLIALFEWKDTKLELLDSENISTKVGYDISFQDIVGSRDKEVIVELRSHHATGMWSKHIEVYSIHDEKLIEILNVDTMDYSVDPTKDKQTWYQKSIQYPPFHKTGNRIDVITKTMQVTEDGDNWRVIDTSITENAYVWNENQYKFVPEKEEK